MLLEQNSAAIPSAPDTFCTIQIMLYYFAPYAMLHEPYSADIRTLLQQKTIILLLFCQIRYVKNKARLLVYNYYSVVFVSLCCFMFSSIQYIIMIFCLFLLPSQTDNDSLDAVMLLWLAGGMHKAI